MRLNLFEITNQEIQERIKSNLGSLLVAKNKKLHTVDLSLSFVVPSFYGSWVVSGYGKFTQKEGTTKEKIFFGILYYAETYSQKAFQDNFGVSLITNLYTLPIFSKKKLFALWQRYITNSHLLQSFFNNDSANNSEEWLKGITKIHQQILNLSLKDFNLLIKEQTEKNLSSVNKYLTHSNKELRDLAKTTTLKYKKIKNPVDLENLIEVGKQIQNIQSHFNYYAQELLKLQV